MNTNHRRDCYFCREFQDMGATIIYCAYNSGSCICPCTEDCEHYISVKRVEDMVRKQIMKGNKKKWIPCSEGYPEMDERVLVNLDGRYDIHVWDCMSNRSDSYFWEDEAGLFHDKYEVLYWMRIPELSGDE